MDRMTCSLYHSRPSLPIIACSLTIRRVFTPDFRHKDASVAQPSRVFMVLLALSWSLLVSHRYNNKLQPRTQMLFITTSSLRLLTPHPTTSHIARLKNSLSIHEDQTFMQYNNHLRSMLNTLLSYHHILVIDAFESDTLWVASQRHSLGGPS